MSACIRVERHQMFNTFVIMSDVCHQMVTLRRFTDLKRVYGREWLWATWSVGTRVGRGPRAHTHDPHVLTSMIHRLLADCRGYLRWWIRTPVRSLQTWVHPSTHSVPVPHWPAASLIPNFVIPDQWFLPDSKLVNLFSLYGKQKYPLTLKVQVFIHFLRKRLVILYKKL